jgi:D-glycero-D-manno-heptose 1,7-bisphosphate phosphatase
MKEAVTMKPSAAHSIRYVFLDRDGVLNRKMPEGGYVTDAAHFEWLPGAKEAVARMNHARVTVILVTNQRAIALGLIDDRELASIHTRMQDDLARHGAHLDAIYYCPHDRGECHCRKPATGLFEQALQQFPEANSENSVVIGDSLSDIVAGKRLGMKTVFIQGEPDRQKAGSAHAAEAADFVVGSLLDAVESYLGL